MSHDRGVQSPYQKNEQPVKLAVFDFDGTSITGNSPVLLVRYLLSKKMLSKRAMLRILSWAFAYKFRLPQNESWVRSWVFSAFEGMPKQEADAFMYTFYDTVIAERFRPAADEAMRRHRDEGCVIIVVSATFEPIVLEAMKLHPFEYQISTRMQVDKQGNYTRKVEGLPVEGEEKLHAVARFANERFGAGAWKLAYAYGDHHSDRPLLKAADTAFAVTPDQPLRRTAIEKGWEILDWS